MNYESRPTSGRLQPKEHLEVRNDVEARAMGLSWDGKPYGALLCVDTEGRRVTVITTDIDYHRMVVDATDDLRAGLDIPTEKYGLRRDAWPGDRGWRRSRPPSRPTG